MISHFKTTLKTGLQQGGVYFDFSTKKASTWSKQDGQEHREEHTPWTAEHVNALFTQFFPHDLDAIQAGKVTRGILTIVNHGNLILLAHPGDEPRLEIFVPPHGEAKFEETWNALQNPEPPQNLPPLWTPNIPDATDALPVSMLEEQNDGTSGFIPTEIPNETPQGLQEPASGSVCLSAPMDDEHAIEVKQTSRPLDMPVGTALDDDHEKGAASYEIDEGPSRSIPLTSLSGGADLVELSFLPPEDVKKEVASPEKHESEDMFSISHTQMGLNIWMQDAKPTDTPLANDASDNAANAEASGVPEDMNEVGAFIPPPPTMDSAPSKQIPTAVPPPFPASEPAAHPYAFSELGGDEAMGNPFSLHSIQDEFTKEPIANNADVAPTSHAFAQMLAGLTQPGWWECFGLSGSPVYARHDIGVERQMRTWPAREELENLLLKSMPDSMRQQWQEQGEATFCYGLQIRHRVRAIRSQNSIHIAVRALMQPLPTWEQLGLPGIARKFADLNRGLVLVCGPSNSGRSTTLAALLNHITKTRKTYIQTLEQPVEYIIEAAQGHVWQQEIANSKDLSHFLEQIPLSNPDVVMVADVNQPRVLREALLLAEKGHLVLAGFTANTSMHAIERMIDLFPTTEQAQVRHQIADNLRGIVAQLLLQKRTGGRIPACDVLVMNKAAQALIREDKMALIANNVQSKKSEGHVLLHESILALVQNNVVDAREAQARTPDRDMLQHSNSKKSGSAA